MTWPAIPASQARPCTRTSRARALQSQLVAFSRPSYPLAGHGTLPRILSENNKWIRLSCGVPTTTTTEFKGHSQAARAATAQTPDEIRIPPPFASAPAHTAEDVAPLDAPAPVAPATLRRLPQTSAATSPYPLPLHIPLYRLPPPHHLPLIHLPLCPRSRQ